MHHLKLTFYYVITKLGPLLRAYLQFFSHALHLKYLTLLWKLYIQNKDCLKTAKSLHAGWCFFKYLKFKLNLKCTFHFSIISENASNNSFILSQHSPPANINSIAPPTWGLPLPMRLFLPSRAALPLRNVCATKTLNLWLKGCILFS